jgi:hypothetical protein
VFGSDIFIYASEIGIKDENEMLSLQNKAHWFYNVCEALEYTEIVGKRLAQICRNINNDLSKEISYDISIEANSVLLMILNLSDSYFDLFIFPDVKKRIVPCSKNDKECHWETTVLFKKNPTFRLIKGLRNALVHRHPINTRNMRYLGTTNRMGIALSPIEFNRYIHLPPNIIEEPMTRKKIKFIREEPFDPKYGFRPDWFAWDKGKTLCFLDCEDFGNGISDFLFGLLSDVVKRNDGNIRDLLILLRKIKNKSVYLPANRASLPAINTSYSVAAYHVTEPFITRLL